MWIYSLTHSNRSNILGPAPVSASHQHNTTSGRQVMEDPWPSLSHKQDFFRRLESFSSNDELGAEEQDHRRRCRGFFHSSSQINTTPYEINAGQDPERKLEDVVIDPNNPPNNGQQHRGSYKRTISAPDKVITSTPATVAPTGRIRTLMDGEPVQNEVQSIPDSNGPKPTPTLQRSSSTSLLHLKRPLCADSFDSPSGAAAATKRRRREPAIKYRLQEEQIFGDLAFFYIPNDDVAPARRLRISKAREYGATWVRSIDIATHVVVDKKLQYKDVEPTIAGAPRWRSLKVVNEDYPIDCIQFKSIVNHDQKKYRVTGQPTPQAPPAPPPASSEESTRSLQLKAPQRDPNRWDYVPPEGTPLRSEGSTPREAAQRARGEQDGTVEESRQGAVDGQEAARNTIDRQRSGRKADQHHDSTTETRMQDELSTYIDMMQQFKNLPLDVEDDDGHSAADGTETVSDSDNQDSEDGPSQKQPKQAPRSSRKDIAFDDRFACNQAAALGITVDNPNARTIEVLQSMANYYNETNDHWRTTAYRKAINTLKRQGQKVTTEAEAFRLPSIGRRLAQKIEEIVTTDKLQRLEHAQDEPTTASLQLFLKIYGVGNKQAQRWISQGFRTLDDVRTKAQLSANQLVGINHFEDLNARIPRSEVQKMGDVVKAAAYQIDPQVEVIVGGSYRRGSPDSGDIDLVVTKANTESSRDLRMFLAILVKRLNDDGFLVERLASSRSSSGDGSKWHGCCVCPKITGFNDVDYRPVWRRIDFLLVPEAEIGAALIYFTGNDIFNRSMRLLASKKGMRLNQRGLYKDVLRGSGRERVTAGELLEGRDERRIFEILGVKWREPHERWC